MGVLRNLVIEICKIVEFEHRFRVDCSTQHRKRRSSCSNTSESGTELAGVERTVTGAHVVSGGGGGRGGVGAAAPARPAAPPRPAPGRDGPPGLEAQRGARGPAGAGRRGSWGGPCRRR